MSLPNPTNTIIEKATLRPEGAPAPKPACLKYRNGREVQGNYEPVVFRNNAGVLQVGILKIQKGQTTTKVTVSIACSGGLGMDTVEIGDVHHAEDAALALEANLPKVRKE